MLPRPPGPPPHRRRDLVRTLWSRYRLARDPIAFVGRRFRQYGDLYFVDEGGGSHLYITRSPAVMREVLVEKAASFRKAGGANDRLRPWLGSGLLTSDGELWRRQRRSIQPGFHHRKIEGYGRLMVDHARDVQWADGSIVDVSTEMMALTLRIVCKALFDHDARDDRDRVRKAMEHLRRATNPALLPLAFSPRWRRGRGALVDLHAIIDEMVARRRREGLRDDLLSMLLGISDGPDGMGDAQLRDELVTLFLAGHETTSHGLTWTWYLLSENRDAEARLHAELDETLGGRPPTVDDLPRLPYTAAVVKEALRLYPPAYVVARVAQEPVEVGGYPLASGAQVVLWIWHAHHDARSYADPERFQPTREHPRDAWLPFGSGPRMCIGSGFAQMELQLVLASLAQRYRLRRCPDQRVAVSPRVTLAPRYGMRMVVSRR